MPAIDDGGTTNHRDNPGAEFHLVAVAVGTFALALALGRTYYNVPVPPRCAINVVLAIINHNKIISTERKCWQLRNGKGKNAGQRQAQSKMGKKNECRDVQDAEGAQQEEFNEGNGGRGSRSSGYQETTEHFHKKVIYLCSV